MVEGKRITMAELVQRRSQEIAAENAQRDAWHATPEGRAEKLERDASDQRLREADERFARENPPDPAKDGRDAALAGQKRKSPQDLTEEDEDQWLEGYDSAGSDED